VVHSVALPTEYVPGSQGVKPVVVGQADPAGHGVQLIAKAPL